MLLLHSKQAKSEPGEASVWEVFNPLASFQLTYDFEKLKKKKSKDKVKTESDEFYKSVKKECWKKPN